MIVIDREVFSSIHSRLRNFEGTRKNMKLVREALVRGTWKFHRDHFNGPVPVQLIYQSSKTIGWGMKDIYIAFLALAVYIEADIDFVAIFQPVPDPFLHSGHFGFS